MKELDLEDVNVEVGVKIKRRYLCQEEMEQDR